MTDHHVEMRDVDFMDAIIHSPQLYVLGVGSFVEYAPYTDWVKVYYQRRGSEKLVR